jgi:hypothetical protein
MLNYNLITLQGNVDFKDITKEANKYKERSKHKSSKKLDEEVLKREKISVAFDKEVQQIKDQRERKTLAEKEMLKIQRLLRLSHNIIIQQQQQQQNHNSLLWQERNAQIQAEIKRIYQQNQQRIAETQRRSQQQSEQFVNGATELIGMVGNIFEQARIDREKKKQRRQMPKRERQTRRQEEADRLRKCRQKSAVN